MAASLNLTHERRPLSYTISSDIVQSQSIKKNVYVLYKSYASVLLG